MSRDGIVGVEVPGHRVNDGGENNSWQKSSKGMCFQMQMYDVIMYIMFYVNAEVNWGVNPGREGNLTLKRAPLQK